MAERTLQKVEGCSICLDTYTNPKLLQTAPMSTAMECLVRLVVRDQLGKLSLTCPTCRHTTPIPDAGVSALQSAFHINHLLEVVREHKKNLSCCADHVDEELKLFLQQSHLLQVCLSRWPASQPRIFSEHGGSFEVLCHRQGPEDSYHGGGGGGGGSIVTVQAVSWSGCPCIEPIKSLECELECVQGGVGVRGGVGWKEREG